MILRDFNPNKYNTSIWLCDLCISTNKVITYIPLINIEFIDGYNKTLKLLYDISHTTLKKFNYFKWVIEQEPNLIGSFVAYQDDKQVYELRFRIPRYSFAACDLRRKYLFKYATRVELISVFTFWDGYVKFLPLKKAAARESSRLYFFVILSSLAFRSIYV